MSKTLDQLINPEAQVELKGGGREPDTQQAARKKQLRFVTAKRVKQERQSPNEVLASQVQQYEAAIVDARIRAAGEIRRAGERDAQLAQEAWLESLARTRAQAEKAEQEALAARIEAERKLAAQLATRLEQEKIGNEQTAQRILHEEQLRLAAAERETRERQLQDWEQEALAQQHETAITDKMAPDYSMDNKADEQVIAAKSSTPGGERYYFGLLATALLGIGVGYFMATNFQFLENKPRVAPVQHVADKAPAQLAESKAPASVVANVASTEKLPALDAAKQQEVMEAEIRQMTMQWAEAWSRRDTAAYLSFYAADFNLPEGMQRADWEAQRQSRLRKYRSIEVTLKNIQISHASGDIASVSFAQDFQADKYKEFGVQKELSLKRIESRWLIVSEKSL